MLRVLDQLCCYYMTLNFDVEAWMSQFIFTKFSRIFNLKQRIHQISAAHALQM